VQISAKSIGDCGVEKIKVEKIYRYKKKKKKIPIPLYLGIN
jgi:hypothetical protein